MTENEKKSKDSKDDDKTMETEYAPLKKKYSLPELMEIDKEFLLGDPEPGNFPLRVVLGRMTERCDFVLKILNAVIQPENHLSDMKESEQLSDEDRRKVFEIVNKMSFFEKEFMIREFEYSEEKSAALIKEFHAEWIKVRPDFIKILASMQKAWTQKKGHMNEYNYFG